MSAEVYHQQTIRLGYQDASAPVLSVIAPIYNEARSIPELYCRLYDEAKGRPLYIVREGPDG